MKCSKCGKEVPEGTGFCGSCGAAVGAGEAKGQNQVSQWWAATAALLSRDPVVAVVGLGALLLCLGAFLPWWNVRYGADVLGLQMEGGPVVLALGAFLVLTLVLSRGGTPGAWSIVILVLSAVCLTLVVQTMIYLDDHDAGIGAGLYVAIIGGFATASGGLLETMRVLKK